MQDNRAFIPLLTGRLRDSGHLTHDEANRQFKNYVAKVIWDAENPRNHFVYAKKQYEEILNHIDGRYAAEWAKKVLQINRVRYQVLLAINLKIEFSRVFKEEKKTS